MREQNGIERLVKVDIGGGRLAFVDPVTVMRILDEPGGRTAICGAGWSVLCTLAASEVYAALNAKPERERAAEEERALIVAWLKWCAETNHKGAVSPAEVAEYVASGAHVTWASAEALGLLEEVGDGE